MTDPRNITILLFALLLYSCTERGSSTGEAPSTLEPGASSETGSPPKIREPDLSGDFDGNGTMENAWIKITRKGVPEKSPYYFSITFSDSGITPLNGFNTSSLDSSFWAFNEGNLDRTSGDDISLYFPPQSGTIYSLCTYRYSNHHWSLLAEPLIVPEAFFEEDGVPLDSLVFRENDTIWQLEVDVNEPPPVKFRKKAAVVKPLFPQG